MSTTTIGENHQIKLPEDVCRKAGVGVCDQVDWRFEEGEIRGRKIPFEEPRELGEDEVDPITLLPKFGKINRGKYRGGCAPTSRKIDVLFWV